jgi:hypothetical protein
VCIAGRDNTNCDDEADLLSIEELRGQISRQGISTGHRNSEDTLQYLEEPAPNTSGSRLSLTQLTLDDGAGNSQGTRGMRVGSLPLYIKQSPDYTQKDR